MRYEVEVNGRCRQVIVHRENGRFRVQVDGRLWSIDASMVDSQTLSLLVNGAGDAGAIKSHEIVLAPDAGTGSMTVRVGGVPLTVRLNGGRRRGAAYDKDTTSGPQRLVAPMPGKVVRVLARPGDLVRARQPIVVVEAMKMENEIRAGRPGRIAQVAVRDGQSVEAGALLAVVEDS